MLHFFYLLKVQYYRVRSGSIILRCHDPQRFSKNYAEILQYNYRSALSSLGLWVDEKKLFHHGRQHLFWNQFRKGFWRGAQYGAQQSADITILLRGSVRVRWRHYSPSPKRGGENIPRDLRLWPTCARPALRTRLCTSLIITWYKVDNIRVRWKNIGGISYPDP